MKTAKKLALLAALGIALTGVNAMAQADSNDPAPGQPGPPPGRPRLAQVLTDILQKYDVNKDGQLDQAEMAALQKDIADGKIEPPRPAGGALGRGPGGPGGQRPPPLSAEILAKYDVNKDGKLDESERAALHQDIQDGKIQVPLGRGPGGPGAAGFAPPSAKELLARFDADKDGKLDETELAALLQELHQHRPPRGPGGPDQAPQQ